jgi:ferritin-like metal-binding protein YciE
LNSKFDFYSLIGLISDRETCSQEIGNNPQLRDIAIAYGQIAALCCGVASYGGLITAAVQKGQKDVINRPVAE